MFEDEELFEKGVWGYRSYRQHLMDKFPGKVIRKLCLNAGFSCPNLDGTVSKGGCTYCSHKGFAPRLVGGIALMEQWDAGRLALRNRYGKKVDGFIAYFQSYSNTHAELPQLKSLYDGLWEVLPECYGVSISTRPDCLDAAKVDWLDEMGQKTFLTLEMGLQSDRDACLEMTNRGHSVADFFRAIDMARGRSFEICVHFILGLPGEGADAPERMGRLAAELPVQSVKIHNLHIMKGTAMADDYEKGKLKVMDELDYRAGVFRFLNCLRPDQCAQRVLADAPEAWLLSGDWCQDKQGFLATCRSDLFL